jgi:hypothetical protein
MTLSLSLSNSGMDEFGSDNVAVVQLNLISLIREEPRVTEGSHALLILVMR